MTFDPDYLVIPIISIIQILKKWSRGGEGPSIELLFWQDCSQLINSWLRLIVSGLFISAVAGRLFALRIVWNVASVCARCHMMWMDPASPTRAKTKTRDTAHSKVRMRNCCNIWGIIVKKPLLCKSMCGTYGMSSNYGRSMLEHNMDSASSCQLHVKLIYFFIYFTLAWMQSCQREKDDSCSGFDTDSMGRNGKSWYFVPQ